MVGGGGRQDRGLCLNWRYQLDLASPDERGEVSFDDRMYLLDDDRLINRAKISKFGIHLGEVILISKRLEQ